MKLFLILAAASLLIVASHADSQMRSKCRKQMRMMEPQLEQCEGYMTMDMMDDDSMRGRECRSEESCMRGCCLAMKEMDDECMCEWMKMMVQQQRGEMGEEDMRMVMRKMKQLPNKCGMGHMRCHMGIGTRDYE
uniref:BW10KD allergen protein n=1 Tax=Fagopyrum esculentum TaxID=3617 RepID=Q8W3Y9_FAGES|nr:BW10KD allergen protein [Fagopyrum esculentum]BAB79444.1 BW8KD allergen protein [Fagopyrum esculentum]